MTQMEHEPENELRMSEVSLKSLTDHQLGTVASVAFRPCAFAGSEGLFFPTVHCTHTDHLKDCCLQHG